MAITIQAKTSQGAPNRNIKMFSISNTSVFLTTESRPREFPGSRLMCLQEDVFYCFLGLFHYCLRPPSYRQALQNVIGRVKHRPAIKARSGSFGGIFHVPIFSQVTAINYDIFSFRVSKHQHAGNIPRIFSAVPAQAGKTSRYFLGQILRSANRSLQQVLYHSISTAMAPDQYKDRKSLDLRPKQTPRKVVEPCLLGTGRSRHYLLAPG